MLAFTYRLTRGLALLSAVVGMLMAAIIIVSVAMRYVLGEPLAIQEEIVGLLFCSMVFLSLAHCTYDGTHVCATLVRDVLGPKGKAVADFGAMLAIVAFGIVFAKISYDFTYLSYKLGARSTVGNFLLYPWMALMPIMSLLSAIVAVLRFFRKPPQQPAEPAL